VESLNFELAGDLKKSKLLVIKKLTSIKSYRGLRRTQGLPVRGQRTHTNSKTSRKIR
jgi:small subunit ribosomal protein S13